MPVRKTFLVTGATGFVGQHLCEALIRQHGADAVVALVQPGCRTVEMPRLERLERQGVRTVKVDLLQLPQVLPPSCDVIYHLAAYAETESPTGNFAVNSDGTRNLLHWLGGNLKGKRVIYTGTLASMDRDQPLGPLTETSVCYPKTPYGHTKLRGEEFLRSQSSELGYHYTILRLCTIIGPGYRSGGMFGIFPRLLKNRALGVRLNWPGRCSFLAVHDLVGVLLKIASLPEAANEIYVMSNGEAPTFNQFLDEIAEVLNLPRQKIALPRWAWQWIGLMSRRGASLKFAPYSTRIFCWRIAHMVTDGLLADNSKLRRVVPCDYQSIREALQQMYSADPPGQRPE